MKKIVISGAGVLTALVLTACGTALSPRGSDPQFGPVAENYDDSRYIEVCTETRDGVVYHVDPALCTGGVQYVWSWYPYGVYLPMYNQALTSVPGKQTTKPAGKPVTRYSPSIYKAQTPAQQAPQPRQQPAPTVAPPAPRVQQPAPVPPRVQPAPAPVKPAPAPVAPRRP